jgi:hypothetical protein
MPAQPQERDDMQLPSRVRAAFERLALKRQAYSRLPLRQMPTPYLMTVAAPSAGVVMLMQPPLAKATDLYFEQILPIAPWYVSIPVCLLLLAWWAMVGMSALLAATHGKALGERLFNTPPEA